MSWLSRVTFPAGGRDADSSVAAGMAGQVTQRLLTLGTTVFASYATVHHRATRAVMQCV